MSNRHTMGRRQFLAVSAASAVATAVLGPNLFAAGQAAGAPRRIAIGFASVEDSPVFAASGIPATDGGFISRGARITVNRTSGAPRDPIARRAVELRAHFAYFDGAERKSAPFTAWASSRRSGGQGSSAAFTYPVDETQQITLSLRTESGAPSGGASRREALAADATITNELPLVLSLRNEEGTTKLARGFYVIVPLFENDTDPRWGAYSLRAHEGRRAMVDSEGKVAPFEHFVVQVDYAG